MKGRAVKQELIAVTQKLIKFTLWVMRQDEEVDAGSSCSGAKDGDPLRVSAEVTDVLIEPTQSLNLVQQAIVPLGRLVSSTEEAYM